MQNTVPVNIINNANIGVRTSNNDIFKYKQPINAYAKIEGIEEIIEILIDQFKQIINIIGINEIIIKLIFDPKNI